MEVQNSNLKRPNYYGNEKYLTSLKERLIQADMFIYNDEIDNAIEQYMQLAKDFIDRIKDYHVSAYLYKKCMELAKKKKVNFLFLFFKDLSKEALAEMGFAKCHDLFDKADEAIENLEAAMQKAELAKDSATVREVSKELIQIYQKLAEKYEIDAKDFDENIDTALKYFEKCLEVCEKTGQRELQGEISNKIGKIYFNHKMFEKSIKHQKTVLELAEQIKDVRIYFRFTLEKKI